MIPRIIHLIWFGEPTVEVRESVEAYRRLNPDWNVRLHASDEELNPRYRALFDMVTIPQLRSDLLRWSVMEKHGGWYFDIDIVPQQSVKTIEEDLALDGSLMFLTCRRSLPNNDIIAVGIKWPHWHRMHEYFDKFQPGKDHFGRRAVQYSCFSLDAIMIAIIGQDGKDNTRWTVGPDDRFTANAPGCYAYRRHDLTRG